MDQKAARFLLFSTEPVPLLDDVDKSYFYKSKMMILEHIFDQCLLFKFVT
jgi:hypothetical protein